MKQPYFAPEMEILTAEFEGCLCQSTQNSPVMHDTNEEWTDYEYEW